MYNKVSKEPIAPGKITEANRIKNFLFAAESMLPAELSEKQKKDYSRVLFEKYLTTGSMSSKDIDFLKKA